MACEVGRGEAYGLVTSKVDCLQIKRHAPTELETLARTLTAGAKSSYCNAFAGY